MKNKRQFPRVELGGWRRDYRAIIGAEVVEYEVDAESYSGEKLKVLDLSYNSLAIELGAGDIETHGISKGILMSFEILLPSLEKKIVNTFSLQGEVVRIAGSVIALKVEKLSGEARLSLEHYLKDKMIGANTYLVNSKFYSDSSDFDFWYHGPGNTNIVIWEANTEDNKNIEAFIEMGSAILLYKEGNVIEVNSEEINYGVPSERKQLEKNWFVENDKDSNLPSKQILQKSIGILSQIEKNDNLEAYKHLENLCFKLQQCLADLEGVVID